MAMVRLAAFYLAAGGDFYALCQPPMGLNFWHVYPPCSYRGSRRPLHEQKPVELLARCTLPPNIRKLGSWVSGY